MKYKDIEDYLRLINDKVQEKKIQTIGVACNKWTLDNNEKGMNITKIYDIADKIGILDNLSVIQSPVNLLESEIILNQYKIDDNIKKYIKNYNNNTISIIDFMKQSNMLIISDNPFESGIKGRPTQFYSLDNVNIDDVTKRLFESLNILLLLEKNEYPKIQKILKEIDLPTEGACNIGHTISSSLTNINNLNTWLYKYRNEIIPDLKEFHKILGEYKVDMVKKYSEAHKLTAIMMCQCITQALMFNENEFLEKINKQLNKQLPQLSKYDDIWLKSAEILKSVGVDCLCSDHLHVHEKTLPYERIITKEEGIKLLQNFKLPDHTPIFISKDIDESQKQEKIDKIKKLFETKQEIKENNEKIQFPSDFKFDPNKYNPLL